MAGGGLLPEQPFRIRSVPSRLPGEPIAQEARSPAPSALVGALSVRTSVAREGQWTRRRHRSLSPERWISAPHRRLSARHRLLQAPLGTTRRRVPQAYWAQVSKTQSVEHRPLGPLCATTDHAAACPGSIANAKSMAASAWRRVVSKTGRARSSWPISIVISVQPRITLSMAVSFWARRIMSR